MTRKGKRKPEPHFEVYLRGAYPEDVPVRAMADLIGAVRSIVAGDDEDGEANASVSLLDINRGSAVYRCLSSEPDIAIPKLRVVGNCIRDGGKHQDLAEILPQLRDISHAAEMTNCDVVVREYAKGGKGPALIVVKPSTYKEIRDSQTVKGHTELLCQIERVGGVDRSRCMVRVPRQRKAVYCTVARDRARDLAKLLYQDVVLSGTAVWIRHTRRIIDFKIDGFRPYSRSRLDEVRDKLRRAGADRWDRLSDSYLLFTDD